MNVELTRLFRRDVRQLGSAQIRRRLDRTIQELIEADNITAVNGRQATDGLGEPLRIRIGGYRLGITVDAETAVLRRFLPRGEVYRWFP